MKGNKFLTPAVWLLYLLIVFEILYMISPFALFYYGTYGPVLNVLHGSPLTAWLSGFYLPHFTEVSPGVLDDLFLVGWFLFLVGIVFFLVAASQIYYAKFRKKGAVTRGLYARIRHPQYLAFAIMGLGMVLAWPRFAVLVTYITMLFVYYLLARREEKICEALFGEPYRTYKARTSMFIPGDRAFSGKLPALPKSGWKRVGGLAALYLMAMILSVSVALALRNYALSNISALYGPDEAVIATASMTQDDLAGILKIALDHPEVQSRLQAAGYGTGAKLLIYVVPEAWFLPDIPLETSADLPAPAKTKSPLEHLKQGGHHTPKTFDRNQYKILFTRAQLSTEAPVQGMDIVKKTIMRTPIVVVKLNKATGTVLSIEDPPPHVYWGHVPTPLF